jgi:hypothetical protein
MRISAGIRGMMLLSTLAASLCEGTQSPAGEAKRETTTVSCDTADFGLSPYVWKRTGTGALARAEATMPGAYVKLAFRGSAGIGLIIDGAANRGCPAPSMPVIEYSVDEGPFRVVPLIRTGEVYTLPLADGLDVAIPHRVDIYFRAADLGQERWTSSRAHLRIAGIALDAGGALVSRPRRSRPAIGFGDSIVEGVGVDGLFTSWQILDVNNARGSWFPLVCAALNCEYGQLGTGGQGMVRGINLPPLTQTWDHYDATTSRLTNGRLLQEPEYVFCGMGTNDFESDITADYTGWLAAVRAACPHTRVFCVVPPLGLHEPEIRAAVEARNKAGDLRVHMIDTAPLKSFFRVGKGATQFAYDGVHPSQYGNAVLGAFIAVEVEKLCGEQARATKHP